MSFDIAFEDWGQPQGLIRYGYVPWDSDIFGFPFYQVDFPGVTPESGESLQGLLSFLAQEGNGKCLVFTKVPSHDIRMMRVLTRAGFYAVETMVEPHREIKSFRANRRFERLRLRPATVDDKTELLNIAQRGFSKDRFHLDPNLPEERASERYASWLDKGLQSGETILIYEDTKDKKCLGFCHLREKGEALVDFALAALDPAYQKTGLGVMMYSECLLECQKRGYTQVETRISINNIGVLNIYAHLGFLFRRPVCTLHWYSECAQDEVSSSLT